MDTLLGFFILSMKSILKYYTILLASRAILSGIAGSVSLAKGAAKDILSLNHLQKSYC